MPHIVLLGINHKTAPVEIRVDQFEDALYIHVDDEAVRHVFRVASSLDSMVLLIGAGEMAELAVEHLIRNKVGDILVANRTFESGVQLAHEFNGKAIRFEEIRDCLKFVDIIISSTGAPDFIITRDYVKGVIRTRRNRPIFLYRYSRSPGH